MIVSTDCPCCGARIDVSVDPGEEPVYYPTERAHPGAPAEIDDIEGCECWEYLDRQGVLEAYHADVLELAAEAADDRPDGDEMYDRMVEDRLMEAGR